MTLWSGPLLPLVVLVWPLLLGLSAAFPLLRDRALRLLPLAPLPALVLALAGQSAQTEVPELLLGVTLALDDAGRLLLGMTAGLWLAAGLFAQSMAGERNLALFTGFWCLTLTGNLGVFLAGDVITFYVAFAAVSLAAWFLVVHTRSPEALHAGRLYITLAVVGEVCLLAGFLIGVQAADSLIIADIRAALADAPLGGLAVALLVAGFGVKAGVVPLHVWLPLAHPAAPVAASAVLSGAIVKAGLVGFWLFLPPGAFGAGLVALGLAGAFGAALWGLTQANPKAVLAYSTISQMGVMVALIGAGATAQAVAFHAFHHGLAKGALFLSVGLVLTSSGLARRLALGLAALAALSVAGLPLTGGGAVKAAAKAGLPEGLGLALTGTGATTALVMGWFLWRLVCADRKGSGAGLSQGVAVLALALGAVVLPWIVWPGGVAVGPGYALSSGALVDALWPAGLAMVLALMARALGRAPATRPPGDLLLLFGVPVMRAFQPPGPDIRPRAEPLIALAKALGAQAESGERVLLRWRWSGLGVIAAVLGLAFLML